LIEPLPLFPLGVVLFPGMVLPLHIFEPRYRLLMARRLDSDPAFGVVLTRLGREVGDQPETHEVGTAATLLRAVRYEDGRYDIAVRGGRRFRIHDGQWDEGYLTGMVEWIDPPEVRHAEVSLSLVAQAKRAFNDYLDALERSASVTVERVDLGQDAELVGYAITLAMPFDVAQRQRLLEAETTSERLDELVRVLRRERDLLLATGIVGAAIERPGARFSTN
jgi:Lon protease-like protein